MSSNKLDITPDFHRVNRTNITQSSLGSIFHQLTLRARISSKENALQAYDPSIEYTYADQRIYTIIAALRGPDNEDQGLKGITTARLRGFLGLNSDLANNHMGLDIQPHPLTQDQLNTRQRYDKERRVDSHFLNHFHLAIDAVRILTGYNLENETLIDQASMLGFGTYWKNDPNISLVIQHPNCELDRMVYLNPELVLEHYPINGPLYCMPR